MSEPSGHPDKPVPARAYILNQLKHPDEVELLRRVYGASFVLLAAHAPREARVKELARRMARGDNQPSRELDYMEGASKIIQVDEKQESAFGQNTRDTYPMADMFADLGQPGGSTR